MINRIVDVLENSKGQPEEDVARAILKAMRDPTEEMMEAGEIAVNHNGLTDVETDDILLCWQAMIDEALSGAVTNDRDNAGQ